MNTAQDWSIIDENNDILVIKAEKWYVYQGNLWFQDGNKEVACIAAGRWKSVQRK